MTGVPESTTRRLQISAPAGLRGYLASMGLDSSSAEQTDGETVAEGLSATTDHRWAAEQTDVGLVRPVGRGDSVGRYVVLRELGAGGMGVVFLAYDPELDRRVALKLLRPHPGADASRSEGRSRLLREAQALAKLSHPNVVGVHDVGEHDDRVWIAMEFVEGETLKDWLADQRRDWREVLEVMGQAAQGLIAAHAAHLLHRDFKPDKSRTRPRSLKCRRPDSCKPYSASLLQLPTTILARLRDSWPTTSRPSVSTRSPPRVRPGHWVRLPAPPPSKHLKSFRSCVQAAGFSKISPRNVDLGGVCGSVLGVP